VSTLAYRYLQTSTDVALAAGDPTVSAPGFLYSSGSEAVKPTNPPANFDELQERMEALDELANMTEKESSFAIYIEKTIKIIVKSPETLKILNNTN